MHATTEPSVAEQAALRGQCTVFLTGHGPVSAAGLLASIPPDAAVDRYGDGGVAWAARLIAASPRPTRAGGSRW